jgi:hypothetical protein
MLLAFETTYHDEQLFLVNCPSKLGSNQFLTFKGNKMPFLHQHTFYCKPAFASVYFKWFGKIWKLKDMRGIKSFFQDPIPFVTRMTTPRLVKSLANAENPVMIFL